MRPRPRGVLRGPGNGSVFGRFHREEISPALHRIVRLCTQICNVQHTAFEII